MILFDIDINIVAKDYKVIFLINKLLRFFDFKV